MMKDIELEDKTFRVEYIIPEEIKKFLQKNKVNLDKIIKNDKWERFIYESLLDNKFKLRKDFKKLKVVINYIHVARDNQIRVAPERFAEGKQLCSPMCSKGVLFKDFSTGFAIFSEPSK